jgi:toxin-antitoxin system PIN domain toxin
MLIADVNVFVGAHRSVIKEHHDYRRWLEDRLVGDETFGVSELVLSAFTRLVTNHRIFSMPTPVAEAMAFCDAVRQSPSAVVVAPTDRHWGIFSELCVRTPARGNLVPDAYLAALAIENGATFATRDRGFARFSGVRLLDPLAD